MSDTVTEEDADEPGTAATDQAPAVEAVEAVDDTEAVADEPETGGDTGETRGSTPRSSRLRTVAVVALIVGLAICAVVGFWQAADQRSQLHALEASTADAAKAQEVASGYAVKAAAIDYRNFDPWFRNLTAGVAKPVADQFTASEPALRDLLGQLQWVSSGTLVGSDIKSQNDGTYVVQVFVDVTTSNVQSPDGVKTTALYPITIDKGAGWQITDISGGVAPLPGK